MVFKKSRLGPSHLHFQAASTIVVFTRCGESAQQFIFTSMLFSISQHRCVPCLDCLLKFHIFRPFNKFFSPQITSGFMFRTSLQTHKKTCLSLGFRKAHDVWPQTHDSVRLQRRPSASFEHKRLPHTASSDSAGDPF